MGARIRKWIFPNRSFFLSLCVVCLLLFLLPSLLSTSWGGYCLQQLIRTTTGLDVRWEKCLVSWFENTHIKGLSLTDHRTNATAFVEQVDSTWRPSDLFSSFGSIGTTTLRGAKIALSLPSTKLDNWPYPFFPSSLHASHQSKLPFYGTLNIEASRLTCKIAHDEHVELNDLTALLTIPKQGMMTCALSATSASQEEQQGETHKGTLNVLVQYTPTAPRKLLRTHVDALRALAENRLHLDVHLHQFPSTLLDALLAIRHPESVSLISPAIGTFYSCRIRTELSAKIPHLSISWESPFLQGTCAVAFTETQHMPPHLHWDAKLAYTWDQRESLLSSSGDYTLPALLSPRGTLEGILDSTLDGTLDRIELSLEAFPTKRLSHLFKSKYHQHHFEDVLGDTIALHLSMHPYKHNETSYASQHTPKYALRVLCLASKLQCDPMEFACSLDKTPDKTLTLLQPVRIQIKDTESPLDMTCNALTISSKHPIQAHFTLPIGNVALCLSSLKLPSLHSPFYMAGEAIFSPDPTETNKQWISVFGSSFACNFSVIHDQADFASSKGEFFLKGDGLHGTFTGKWMDTSELDLTHGSLTWKIGPNQLSALQELWPSLKEWTLAEEATCTLTAQPGPIPLSLSRLKQERRRFNLHIDRLSLLHISSHYVIPLQLHGLLDETLYGTLQGTLLDMTEGVPPNFTLEGSLASIPDIPADFMQVPKSPSASSWSCYFTGSDLPTALLALPLSTMPDTHELFTWLMGKHCSLAGSLTITPETRDMDIAMVGASNAMLQAGITHQIDAMRYIPNRPCTLTLPLSLFVQPNNPILLTKKAKFFRLSQLGRRLQHTNGAISMTLFPERSFLRMPFRSWEDVEIGQLAVDIGNIQLKTPKTRSTLFNLIPKAVMMGKRPLTIQTTPLFFSLEHGKLHLKRVDALIAGRYPIAFWGRIKLPTNHVKATLAISATALRAGFGLSDVSPGYFLLLPMSGSIDNVALHKTKALTRLTALSLHSDGGIPGAFLGSFAHWLGGGFDPESVPPPSAPIPWASLEKEWEQEERQRIAKEQKHRSIPGTLIAPFQAVHRGIQTGVRKGADLLFNLLR